MATSHHLSMIRNSFIKRPIDPNTGLTSTLHERRSSERNNTWAGIMQDELNYSSKDIPDAAYKLTHSVSDEDLTGVMFSEEHVKANTYLNGRVNGVSSGLDDDPLSEDEYYQRLVSLKRAHQKTLKLCEQLYNDKLTGRSSSMSQLAASTDFDGDYDLNTGDRSYVDRMFAQSDDHLKQQGPYKSILKPSRDQVRDMSSKPPTGKAFTTKFSNSRKFSRTSQSYDSDDMMRYLSSQSFDATDDDYENDGDDEREIVKRSSGKYRSSSPARSNLTSSMSYMEDMWDNFSVDEYAPRTRQRSNSLGSSPLRASVKKNKVKEPEPKEWRHRITVPKPFKMTLREATTPKKKSRVMEEAEIQRELKEKQEEAECQKQFKAAPVPAHVYVPLYDEIMEQQEQRRRQNRELAKELISSIEKPFKFTKREEERKNVKNTKLSTAVPSTSSKKKFKARPVPDYIYTDDSILDKLAEEEEYRKIRVKMRAEEMLRSSSLPPNMQIRGKHYTDGRYRQQMYSERAKKAGFTSEHKFRPKIKGDVPDFDRIYKDFSNGLNRKKREKDATVCRPFNLRTSRIPSKKHKIYQDIEKDEQTLKESRWPFRTPRARPLSARSIEQSGTLSTSLDSIPAKMTNATELRSSANRERIMQQTQEELQLLEKERQRRQKERQLKKMVTEKAMANDNTTQYKRDYQEKLRKFREAERARQEEYRRELNEMRDRIEGRPLLFERTAQTIAKQAAERKYKSKLQEAGLDEDFIEKQGSSAIDLDYDLEDYESDDDLTSNHFSRSRSVGDDELSNDDYSPVGSDIDK